MPDFVTWDMNTFKIPGRSGTALPGQSQPCCLNYPGSYISCCTLHHWQSLWATRRSLTMKTLPNVWHRNNKPRPWVHENIWSNFTFAITQHGQHVQKTINGNGCEYQVSRLVVQTKPNRYKVGISDNQSHFNFCQLLSNSKELSSVVNSFDNYYKLSTTLTTFTSCRKF